MPTLLSFLVFIVCILATVSQTDPNDYYTENLIVKPLSSGQVYTHFTFKTVHQNDIQNINWERHYNLFPLSLGKFISGASIQELHFSLTKGYWQHNKWGYGMRDASTGAELAVYFQQYQANPQKAWNEVISTLSGQFCASMNFIDKAATVQPVFSWRPDGVVENGTIRNDLLFYAALPHEAVCTENLTPWKKLLPCFAKSGLSSLLNAVKIFDSNYFSLAMDLKPICADEKCEKTSIELVQSISMVFNPPKMFEGRQSWSLVKLFGSFLREDCKLASKSLIYIDATRNDSTNLHTLIPKPEHFVEEQIGDEQRRFAVYDVRSLINENQRKNITKVNIADVHKSEHVYENVHPPILYANRYITGYGVYQGGITCRIHNNYKTEMRIVYLDIIPWYLRIYTHTMKISTESGRLLKPDSIYYKPAKDRSQPHHLELILTLPPSSVTSIKFEFNRQFLKWTEYPPDANHGVYVDAAIISFKSPTSRNLTILPSETESDRDHFIRVHTEVLLVSLPTPDFSMPYNVICLVSTVVSLAFGPIHGLTTRRAKLIDEDGEESKSKGFLAKFRALFSKTANNKDVSKKDN